MTEFKEDVFRMRQHIEDAHKQTDCLLALADGATMSDARLQQTLERAAHQFEQATLELRTLCEKHSPGVGGYPKHRLTSSREVVGHIEMLNSKWPQITLNTLLPHCRYQPPLWLTDSIRHLLDEHEQAGHRLPCFSKAMLVIDEHSSRNGRHIYDQDNKGWKAVSNALKGRLIPDDDQYSLSIFLLSHYSQENICRITVVPLEDVPEFFSFRPEGHPVL